MKITKWRGISEITSNIPPLSVFLNLQPYEFPKELSEKLIYTVEYRDSTQIGWNKVTREGKYIHKDDYPRMRNLTEHPDNKRIIENYYNEKIKSIYDVISQSGNQPVLCKEESFLNFLFPDYYYMRTPKKISSPWFYKGQIYITSCAYSELQYTNTEFQLLILEYADRERKKWERLNRYYNSDNKKEEISLRDRIPEEVRIAVWRRDDGKCAHCGSRERLEYDHIIPISKGGSNTARNIELLCEKCNREKSANIQ